MWVNLFFLRKKWEKILTKAIKRDKPDLIITQDYFTGISVKVAKKFGIKSIVFLRSYLHLSIDNCKSYLPEENKFSRSKDLIYQLQYPFFKPVVKEIQWALKNTDLVCSVSNYTRDITLKYCDVKSAVVRPFISFRECKTNKKGDFILYINPDKHKGLDIFEKIAERLPEKKFLVIGKEDYKPRTDNITVKGYVSDRKEIFDSARLLLVPSVFPDPHPRVAIEAMVNGIPCIASMRGGLPEELADAGILIKNIFNVDEWVEAIKQFDDMAFYNKMSKLSETRVADFEDITQFAKFDLLLDKLSLNHH